MDLNDKEHDNKQILLFLMHFLSIAPLPPVQRVQYCLLYNATTEKADKFPLLDVPGDKQPLPVISASVHVPHLCAAHPLNTLCHFLAQGVTTSFRKFAL